MALKYFKSWENEDNAKLWVESWVDGMIIGRYSLELNVKSQPRFLFFSGGYHGGTSGVITLLRYECEVKPNQTKLLEKHMGKALIIVVNSGILALHRSCLRFVKGL